MRNMQAMGMLLLAASLPLSGCIIEPDHERDRGHDDRVYVEGGDHHDRDHDREHCDRDGDHCEH